MCRGQVVSVSLPVSNAKYMHALSQHDVDVDGLRALENC